jgi:hypothetical protein
MPADDAGRPRWAALGASARGSVHKRVDRPNEDAVGWIADPSGHWAVVAAADGHGHELAVRADVGSRLAVEAATEVFRRRCTSLLNEGGTFSVETESASVLARWQTAVQSHLDLEPWDDQERQQSGNPGEIEQHPAVAYGTTLLVCAAAGDQLIFCQIGDGEMALVNGGGRVGRPLPDDDRLVGTRTTSLASRTASDDFRGATLVSSAGSIGAVVLATDGYVQSFTEDDGYARAAADVWRLLGDIGPEAVAHALGGWLASTSGDGSGDDATMAVLYDANALVVRGDSGARAGSGGSSRSAGGGD